MSTPMDHIAYLSQEIGPRPAGTEEEQQAALYITERLQKDAHLNAQIEDFTCNSDALMTPIICYAVAIVAVIFGIVLPIAAVPMAVIALAAAAVSILEATDHPVLSQVFTKGVSQNVVAKYEPTQAMESTGARRRKVIVVANYDSGKVRRETKGMLVRALRPLRYGALGGMVAAPVLVLLRGVALPEGTPSVVLAVLAALCVLPALALLVFALMEKFGPYTEAANDNASGIAVMLEVARRLGNGEVSADEPIAPAEEISFAGEPKAPASVSDNLVQVKDAPISSLDDAEVSRQRQETMAALSGAPIGTLAEAAAKAQALNEEHAQAEAAAAAAAADEERNRARHQAEAAAAERAAQEAARKAAAERAAAAARPVEVPEWYRKATEKAREKMGEAKASSKGEDYRSRYADYPNTPAAPAVAVSVHPENVPSASAKPVEATCIPVEKPSAPMTAEAATPSHEEIEAPKPSADLYAAKPAESAAPAKVSQAEDAVEAPAAPAAEPVASSVVEASQPVQDIPDETSAMPAVQAGAINLDKAREIAQQPASEIAVAPVTTSEEHLSEPAAPIAFSEPVVQASESEPAAAPASSAETTRLPQMMYYVPPADRTAVVAERAQKSRVTVRATAAEAEDMAAVESVAVTAISGQSGVAAYEAAIAQESSVPSVVPQADAPAQPAAKVISANIPVVDLPRIELPPMVAPEPKPISFDELRQRAPLASAAESNGREAAQSLLATSVPAVDEPVAPVSRGAYEVDPSMKQNANVSLTGSFAAIGAIGAEPVGDELLAGVDPDDMYVDDADDTVFQEEFTETGAFAGPGYVEMPQSRIGKFFGKFGHKKKKAEEESASEWLGVDENFDARQVGKQRGSWESFRDEDDWEGGAFSNLRARVAGGASEPAAASEASVSAVDHASEHPVEQRVPSDPVSADSYASAYEAALHHAEAASDKIETAEDIQQIYSFAAGDINTEVWFVALGSELADNGGIKAFLAAHAAEMRGAVVVNLEALGGGTLSYLEHEGELKQSKCSARMKRFIKKASQASNVHLESADIDWKESPASYAGKHRVQAMSLVGMDGYAPARYAQANDVVENIDVASVDAAADFVVELLKNI